MTASRGPLDRPNELVNFFQSGYIFVIRRTENGKNFAVRYAVYAVYAGHCLDPKDTADIRQNVCKIYLR
jgi:hypothetical protein